MKVAVLGGTGKMGGAIALALSVEHHVIVGSRDPARAAEAAKRIPGASGADYLGAARQCEAAVFAVPHSAMGEAAKLTEALRGKLVISIVNPIKREGDSLTYPQEKESAAEELARHLPGSRIATAFNNVPERMFGRDHPPVDILVAASSKEAFGETATLASCIPGFRLLYAGPLSQARLVEHLTVLEVNMAKWNGTGRLAPRFVE